MVNYAFTSPERNRAFCGEFSSWHGERFYRLLNSPPMRILLADDQKEICLLAKQQLETCGHSVVAVGNGEDALYALRQQPFDVILLDEEMPGMSGIDVLRAIRGREKQFARLVVIALTGYNTEPDKERLLQAGFDAVLGKPFRLDLLEATLRTTAMGGPSPAAQPVSLASPQASHEDPLTRVGGDEQLLRRMARTFLRDLPPRLAKLEESIHEKRSDTLAFDAHALKGSLSVFGAEKAAALCKALQECGKGSRFADAALTFAALKEAIAELEGNLRGYARQKRAIGPGAPPPAKTKRRSPDSK